MMIYEGLVYHSCGADSRVIIIPKDTELKQCLLHDHRDLPTSDHLGAYSMIGSLSS